MVVYTRSKVLGTSVGCVGLWLGVRLGVRLGVWPGLWLAWPSAGLFGTPAAIYDSVVVVTWCVKKD